MCVVSYNIDRAFIGYWLKHCSQLYQMSTKSPTVFPDTSVV